MEKLTQADSNGVPKDWKIPSSWRSLFERQDLSIIDTIPLDARRQLIYRRCSEVQRAMDAARQKIVET